MKKYVLLLLALSMVLMVSCAREQEQYHSKRQKNENMQDIEILTIKEGQATSTEVVVEDPETEEAVATAPETDESELVPTNPSETNEREGPFPFTTTIYGILNMREGAGTDYEIVTTLYEGDQVTLTSEEFVDGDLWYSATSGIYEGYVQSDAYYLVGPSPEE